MIFVSELGKIDVDDVPESLASEFFDEGIRVGKYS